ncbi:S9 family peptidase [Rhodohalobacter sp.]|uniref:S9 family peptidase n=1 Tax=Rhodohalobacter sp. TaxID=1974210 RepID=UPI002ACE6506|nr:S9 family peptidase [Rhodohalobacter sp.]MDZ7758119.1 S9 family peptidase [Rhodohalobacter sp.]
MRLISYLFASLILFSIQAPHILAQDVPENLTLKEIFHEPVIPGIRPSLRSFNATQDSLYFSWNDSSYYDTGLYKMAITGSEPEAVEDTPARFTPSPNGRLKAYTKDGNIYLSNIDGSNERRIVASKERDISPVWAPNSRKLAFVQDGDVWVTDIIRPDLIQVTDRPSDAPGIAIQDWSGSDRLLLRQTDYSDARTIYFPEYVDEFVTPGASTRGIPSVAFYTADLSTMEIDTLSSGVQRSSLVGSRSGNFSVKDSSDAALKERKVIVYDHRNNTKSVIFEEETDGWLSGTSVSFAPRTDRLMIRSEKSGWNHIYIANLYTGRVEQLTEGDYEITWASWLDDQTIIYANNEADYGERHIFIHDLSNNSIQQLTSEEAYRYQFRLSEDKTKLVYAKTYFNEPYDLYMIDLENPGEEIQLTNSVPESFYDYNWQKEEYVRFTGRDGETGLSMSVLYPKNFDTNRQYPVVVFAHGAGSLQNVYKGWSNNYWREYMFHQYLLNQGYVVVEVDFRHSTGYGRKFREDVTNWMGKYEVEDIVDGLDWVQEKTGGALDLNNVGIYGGSYGGFMALYAVSDAPDRFHAAAALRKVSNWRNYYYANPWYTLPRLGDPEQVPEHYDRSSPLTYASELERPVILLHGLIDDNVGAQDAFQYADALIQSGNTNFEMMIYPSERHGFTSPDSWYDEYLRIYEFFEKHLK